MYSVLRLVPFAVAAGGASSRFRPISVGDLSGSRARSSCSWPSCCLPTAATSKRSTRSSRSKAHDDPRIKREALTGSVKTALRLGDFSHAYADGAAARAKLAEETPSRSRITATRCGRSGCSRTSEQKFQDSLALQHDNARALHGLARSLAARNRLNDALDTAQAALNKDPRDAEFHHTVGSIYERMRRYEEAANAYSSYINLLPNKDRSAKAAWARAEVRFLRAFGVAAAAATSIQASAGKLHTVPFRVLNEKIIVKARVNSGPQMDFVLDTGSEQTVISRETGRAHGHPSHRQHPERGRRRSRRARARAHAARRAGDRARSRCTTCRRSSRTRRCTGCRRARWKASRRWRWACRSIIDYDRQQLLMGAELPDETADVELPLRMHRLAMVPGQVQGGPASFILDTGGQVISISTDTASGLERGEMRNIPLKVYGASGWDRDAFLMPGVNLNFTSKIEYRNLSVVVLNLRAPSVLLGFRLGGIVGYKFLSRYRVAINLDKSIVQLQARHGRSGRTEN